MSFPVITSILTYPSLLVFIFLSICFFFFLCICLSIHTRLSVCLSLSLWGNVALTRYLLSSQRAQKEQWQQLHDGGLFHNYTMLKSWLPSTGPRCTPSASCLSLVCRSFFATVEKNRRSSAHRRAITLRKVYMGGLSSTERCFLPAVIGLTFFLTCFCIFPRDRIREFEIEFSVIF